MSESRALSHALPHTADALKGLASGTRVLWDRGEVPSSTCGHAASRSTSPRKRDGVGVPTAGRGHAIETWGKRGANPTVRAAFKANTVVPNTLRTALNCTYQHWLRAGGGVVIPVVAGSSPVTHPIPAQVGASGP